MKKFWDLSSEERNDIVRQRMSGEKWIVWDYCPNKQGEYGIIEKCPASTDYGFIHGYVFENPKVCALHHDYAGVRNFEINVYTNNWYEDEDFATRHKNMWHIFTSYDKAKAYSDKIKALFEVHPEVEDVLAGLRKVFSDAKIAFGKRGYESTSYECIVCDGGYITARLLDNGLIYIQCGQMGKYIIPHIELLDLAFTDLKDSDGNKRDINLNYCVSESYWHNFYCS